MLVRARYAVAATAVAAGVATLSACGDPISANRDWQAYTSAVTIDATIAQPGVTVHEQQQLLVGKLAASNDGSGSVLPKTTLTVSCTKLTATEARALPSGSSWRCVLNLNTGQRFYSAIGVTPDGVFGTFKSLDSHGSGGTITVSKIREFQPPVPATGLADVPTGGKYYQVRVSARVGQ